jgi:3',5'-cyclic-AMP phosphodiesterase
MEKILQLTDTHLFADGEGALRGTRTAATLSKVLEHVHAHHSDASCLMVTGDLVQQETLEAYQHFIQFFGGFQVPVLCLPGNHDDPALMRQALDRAPFHLASHFSLSSWDIVQLDSHLPGSAAGELTDASLEELAAILKTNRPRPTLVAVHHQPRPVGTAWLDGVGLRNGEALLNCLEGHDHARALIWGHVHQASRMEHRHIKLLGTPSTCAQFLPGSVDFAIDPEAPPAYRVLWLGDDGQLDDELIELPQAADR